MKKCMVKSLSMAAIIVGLTSSHSAWAHHSFAAYDMETCETLEGTVRNYQWTFPHTWIWLFVANDEGGEDIWGFQGEPPSNLGQDGWTRSSLTKGEKIKITFKPIADGRHGGAFSMVEKEDGTLLKGPVGHEDPCIPKE